MPARRSELALVAAALAAWAAIPLAILVTTAIDRGETLTGTTGLYGYDELQYLAWVRDSGEHFLSSNLWGTTGGAHVFLHPLYVVSGLAWRLGMELPHAYLIWRPVAVVVLAAGFLAYVRRMLPDGWARRWIALALSLFFVSPLVPLLIWSNEVGVGTSLDYQIRGSELAPALQLWGTDHIAIAVGLMPVFLVGVARLLSPPENDPASRRRTYAVLVAATGAVVSWLHSWQGLTLLGILVGLVALGPPRRRHVVLLGPALATLLPLIYYGVLTRTDAAWEIVYEQNYDRVTLDDLPGWLIVAGPLAVVALLGLPRRWPRADAERMLLLWTPAALAVYVLDPQFPAHAFEGVSLPLAVLAVRGLWRVRVSPVLAVAAVLAATVPGAIYYVDVVSGYAVRSDAARTIHALTSDENAALRYLSAADAPGPVLAPPQINMVVPAFTGRTTWAGHYLWTPDGFTRTYRAEALFAGRLRPSQAVRLVRESGARYLLANCRSRPSLVRMLRPVARPVRRFGCVTVFAVSS